MTIARVGARTRARASIAAHIDSKEFVPAFFPSFSCLASRARDARGAARGGIRRRETPLQRAPSRASARRARRGAALERRAVRRSTFFFSRDASATTAPSRARVAECRGALARVRGRVTRSRRRDETSHGGMTKKTHVKKFLRPNAASFLLTSSLRVLSHEHHAEPPRGITFDDVAYF